MTMNRHLLPDEFDLLLDEEVGFGVPPLQAHVKDCDQCRMELDSARTALARIELLPHYAPSPLFASKVMAQVNVFEPWHVAATNTVRGLVPSSRPVRVVLGAAGIMACFTLTTIAVWIAAQLDSALLLAGAAYEGARSVAMDVFATLFGQRALAAVGAGDSRLLLGLLAALVVSIAVTIIALRRASRASLATQSR